MQCHQIDELFVIWACNFLSDVQLVKPTMMAGMGEPQPNTALKGNGQPRETTQLGSYSAIQLVTVRTYPRTECKFMTSIAPTNP